MQRFLDPATLAGISGLELVAKTVVDGFVAGLHRSPDFGFSQEFAEYRMYNPGDDLRHVDWNVFARTERAYLKRFRGETNCQITMLLDVSGSMGYTSHGVTKLDYSRYLTASIAYMANHQRDAAGIIVFDEDVKNYIRPSTRQGQFHRVINAIDKVELGKRTDFTKPLLHFQEFLNRRGLVVVISDFWNEPEVIVKALAPLRFHGNEVVLFHILDPQEIQPTLKDSVLLVDMETQDALEVSPEYARHDYKQKMDAHLEVLKSRSKSNGLDYFLLPTNRPLDGALREYLTVRHGRF
jgi:uncharacterized protein (DUF58 family)